MDKPPFNGTQTPYNIGIAGTGSSFIPILDLLTRADFREHFPWAKLKGVADPAPDRDVRNRLGDEGVDLYPDTGAMFEAHPDINMVFDLNDDPEDTGSLRRNIPARVSIVDPFAAMFFWELLVSEKLCSSCRINLSHARALLDAIIDEVKEDILLLDKRGHIVDLNKNAYERLGKPKRELLGLHFWEYDDACRRSDAECPFRKTVNEGVKADAVYTRVDDDGRLQYFRIYTYPIFDEAGELTHVVEMRRDITNRTRMENRLQQSERLAAIGELSTYIAHEIRNPLFAIGGFANSLLRSDNLGDGERDKVRIILDESRRLDGILKSILNFSRPTQAREAEVDVNEVVRGTMEVMGLGCKQQGICMHRRLSPDLARAKGDPELLKQCLINMIKNSVEAMDEGGGDLTVTTFMDDNFIVVRVEDTGRGIPEDIQPKVFNPFFSTKDKGSGLGLAMTKKIVDELGGRVELDSAPGRGTTISLFLPPVLADYEPEPEPLEAGPSGEPGA
jgi:PAS domain S-box-containing protein